MIKSFFVSRYCYGGGSGSIMFEARISWLEGEISRLYELGTQGHINEAARLARELRDLKQAGGTTTGGSASPLPWLLSASMVLSTSEVAKLPDIPTTASKAVIQFEVADETVLIVARSKINGEDPTEIDGWQEFNNAIATVDTRAELLAYRVRKLNAVGDVRIRIGYYGG
jgi:hypothetical protein